MSTVQELSLILGLIKKHNLPLSPILEYAIKDKLAQHSDLELYCKGDSSQVDNPYVVFNKSLEEYASDFGSLSVAISKGKKLPHKAILLLAIIQLIENGELQSNMIPLDNTISDSFVQCWRKYFDSKPPTVWTPFYHLKGEPFWHFKAKDTDERLKMLLSFGGTPSIGKMRPVIEHAYVDEDLFVFFRNKLDREVLKSVLMDTYIIQLDK